MVGLRSKVVAQVMMSTHLHGGPRHCWVVQSEMLLVHVVQNRIGKIGYPHPVDDEVQAGSNADHLRFEFRVAHNATSGEDSLSSGQNSEQPANETRHQIIGEATNDG